MTINNHIPELLLPAGTPEAFCAALDGGADAIYFGASGFNARANARNFSLDEMRSAVYLARTLGVKTYVTLNTVLYDREYSLMLKTAEEIYKSGADAVIVADHGTAKILHEYIPDLCLHASTQCACHNLAAAEELTKLGYTRVVPARELSLENIRYLTKNSPIETEIFVHGALCVSHSGQCLFSSLVGGRSGNRGECAQPCRMNYSLTRGTKGRDKGFETVSSGALLSLKDLTLCRHITDIIDSGVDSLKVEGRMKSPYYVREVGAIYRRLLDERRNASDAEERQLAEIFSRGGFTDAYFLSGARSVNQCFSVQSMSGVRTEAEKLGALSGKGTAQRSGKDPRSQKEAQQETLKSQGSADNVFRTERTRPIKADIELSVGKPAKLTLSTDTDNGTISIEVEGDTVLEAQSAPLDVASVTKAINKFGATRFSAESIGVRLEGAVFMPMSSLNKLRRDATCLLEEKLNAPYLGRQSFSVGEYVPSSRRAKKNKVEEHNDDPVYIKSAYFRSADSITDKAIEYFDIRFLPLSEFDGNERFRSSARLANGIALPPVITDLEYFAAERIAKNAKEAGIRYALVTNLGNIKIAHELGFELYADLRFNIASNESFSAFESLDRDYFFKIVILSPEATLPQMRDIAREHKNASVTVYGRVPLMLLERCILRGNAKPSEGCSVCRDKNYTLIDRTGAGFPVVREWQHRNVIYNSQSIYMADRQNVLESAGLRSHHFIFSVESREEIDRIIDSYTRGVAPKPGEKVRRIK